MKSPFPITRRAFSNVLVLGVIIAILWWGWQAAALDPSLAEPTTLKPVKLLSAASIGQKPKLIIVPAPVSAVELSDSVTPSVTDVPASTQSVAEASDDRPRLSFEPTPIVGPPMPDAAYLNTPLENAEHHTFTLKSMSGYTFDTSITRYTQVRSSTGKLIEFVALHVWQNTGAAHLVDMSIEIGYFTPEDQTFIRNWARQQAAAAVASNDPTPPTPPPTLFGLARQADRLGISRTNKDWAVQVQAQLQAEAAVASISATPQSDPQPTAQQGPVIIGSPQN